MFKEIQKRREDRVMIKEKPELEKNLDGLNLKEGEDQHKESREPENPVPAEGQVTGKTAEKEALLAAMRYLNSKDRSTAEVRTFLSKKEFSPHEIDETMEYLLLKGFLNDLRYAEYFITEAFEKGKSKGKTEGYLLEKGIRESDIRLAFELSSDLSSEELKAMKEAEAIMKRETPSAKSLRKVGARLGYLGFESELIYEIVEKLSEKYEIYDFFS